MTHSYLRHDLFISVPWLIYIHMYFLPDSTARDNVGVLLVYVTWLIHICDMTCSHLCYDSLIYTYIPHPIVLHKYFSPDSIARDNVDIAAFFPRFPIWMYVRVLTVALCVRESVCERGGGRAWEREREGERVCACVCVCVWKRVCFSI